MARTILLSGACGSGKSTLMSLGYRALERHLGPTAVIDTDTVLMMVDPRWELPHEERRLDLAGYQCFLLARSFLAAGFQCVIIGGNGLHTPDEINDLIALLLDLGDVFHVTLDPSTHRDPKPGGEPRWRPNTRVARRPRRMDASRYRSWTCRIDNTMLSPEATIDQVAEGTAGGEGKVTARLRAL